MKGIERAGIENLNSKNVAATVAAFLFLYEPLNVERFEIIRRALLKPFIHKSINGTTIVKGDEGVKKIVAEVIREALLEVVEERDLQLLLVQFGKLIEVLSPIQSRCKNPFV